MQFGSLAQFAQHLLTIERDMERLMQKPLKQAATLVEKTAKAELGHYQPASGPFPEWAPLAEATLKTHAAYGVGDSPLLLTGGLYASIEHEVSGREAVIGTKSEIGAYQEFGTDKIPPRPFMGPAAYNNREKIKHIFASGLANAVAGGNALIGHDITE